MADILIIYYSRTGHTKEMAEQIAQGILQEGGVEGEVRDVNDVKAEELQEARGIIVGSPTYYGEAAYQVRKLFDDSVKIHGKLDGKIGAAFTSAANVGGGNETTILSVLHSMLIHGMIVQGNPVGDHYGPVAINAPDDRCRKQCVELGKRVARLVKQLQR